MIIGKLASDDLRHYYISITSAKKPADFQIGLNVDGEAKKCVSSGFSPLEERLSVGQPNTFFLLCFLIWFFKILLNGRSGRPLQKNRFPDG
jgi:hypothetical protein